MITAEIMKRVWEAVAVIAIAALLMAAGAAIERHLYVTPAQKALASQTGAYEQASGDAKQSKINQEKKQDENTAQSTEDYQTTIDQLIASLANANRMLHTKPKVVYKYVPRPADGSRRSPETGTQSEGPHPGFEPSPCEDLTDADPCSVSREFFNNALMDAAGVDGYANWVARQGFPIGPVTLQ